MHKQKVDIESFIGYKVGKIEVIKFKDSIFKIKYNRYDYIFICKCECGNECEFIYRNLITKQTKKNNSLCCNECKKKKMIGNTVNIKYETDLEAHVGIVYSNYKSRAKKKKIDFLINFEDFKKLLLQACHYCGQEPKNIRIDRTKSKKGLSRECLNGLDRIDSEKGYIHSNIYPCCEDCNKAKRNLSEKQFLQLIKSIYENLKL